MLNGFKPKWIEQASIIEKWHGIRARPYERPAPLLEKLEPGLILANQGETLEDYLHYISIFVMSFFIADDEIGWFFTEVKKIQEALNEFRLR